MCFNVQTYSWPRTPLSEYWRHHACWYTWVWYKERWECGCGAPYKISFLYKGSSLCNNLPPWVKESTSLNDFKHNFRLLNGWIHPEFIVLFICMRTSYPILMLLFYQLCLQLVWYIHIRNFPESYHGSVVFMYDLYLWMCIYVFLISMYFTL